jgi:hypothetical protein
MIMHRLRQLGNRVCRADQVTMNQNLVIVMPGLTRHPVVGTGTFSLTALRSAPFPRPIAGPSMEEPYWSCNDSTEVSCGLT